MQPRIQIDSNSPLFIAAKPLSAHPDDSELFVVIAVWGNRQGETEYVVHNYDKKLRATYHGFYSTDLNLIFAEFARRGSYA